MRFFPVQIDTRDKKLLVIGAGKIATRKLKSFLRSEIKATVIAQDISEEIEELYNKNKINLIRQRVSENINIHDFDIILIATNDHNLNDKLRNKAKASNKLVLDASNGDESSFHLSKIINEKNTLVSVSTIAGNPAITKILADKILDVVLTMDEEKIDILTKIRKELVNKKAKNIKEIITFLYN